MKVSSLLKRQFFKKGIIWCVDTIKVLCNRSANGAQRWKFILSNPKPTSKTIDNRSWDNSVMTMTQTQKGTQVFKKSIVLKSIQYSFYIPALCRPTYFSVSIKYTVFKPEVMNT
mgnify:CR=1 FL=1